MVFRWKDGAHTPKGMKAQAVGEHLEALRERDGILTAQVVVEDARDAAAPTHNFFEWNNRRAADLYRMEQARSLLRSVVVSVAMPGDTKPTLTRAFVVVAEGDGEAYTSLSVAMGDPMKRAYVVARALREFEALKKKYEDLDELSRVFAAIAETREQAAA